MLADVTNGHVDRSRISSADSQVVAAEAEVGL